MAYKPFACKLPKTIRPHFLNKISHFSKFVSNFKASPKAQEFINLEKNYGAHNYTGLPIVVKNAEGIYVWDVDGKKYIDCMGNLSANSQGHSNSYIIEQMLEQLKFLHLTSNVFFNGFFCLI